MNKELVIDVSSEEVSIVLLENKELVEIHKEQNNANFSVGDIYLGKVKKIMPALNAAFVDVGYKKDGFIHYLDLGTQFSSFDKLVKSRISSEKSTDFSKCRREPDLPKEGKISDYLQQGQWILVQISKEPISTKGPRLTGEISVAGRNMVLMPFSEKASISQKIESGEERKRLKRLMESILPANYGVIIRTAGQGKRVAELDEELHGLTDHWASCVDKIKPRQNPILIATEINRATAIVRDMLNDSFNNVYVNNVKVATELKEYIAGFAPELEKIVKYYNGNIPIFDQFNLTRQIKTGFGRIVSLKSGAYLVIDHTEALHVIDVNSGNRGKKENDQETNALAVNLSAAEEIAKQLRLRDMGGIIVIDFIDMSMPDNRKMLFDKMEELMSHDRAKHHILPLSKFGLMQITRQRVRPEMHIETQETCPTCKGSGKIEPSILFEDTLLARLEQWMRDKNEKKVLLHVHPYVATYLTSGFPSIRLKWSYRFKTWISVRPIQGFSYLEYRFGALKNQKKGR